MPNLGMSLPHGQHKTIHEHEFDTSKHRLKTAQGTEPELGMGMYREQRPKPEEDELDEK